MNENTIWEARKLKDKVLKENVLEGVKVLVLTIVSSESLTVKKIEGKEKEQHKYLIESMGVKEEKINYLGKFWEYYTVGETELDVYLNILKKVANKSSVRFPVC